MVTLGYQSSAAYYGIAPVVLYQGSQVTHVVKSGSMLVLVPLAGSLVIENENKGIKVNARSGEPVILRRGTYTIKARNRVVLLRGERCPTAISR